MSARTFVTSLKSVGIVLLVSIGASSPAFADVSLAVRDGRVFLVATDATVAEILAEWARIGQTRLVNAEHIPADRVTLELTNVSEQHALDVLLRRASGYIAASRAIAVPNASQFDRIIVMPPSVAPQTTTAAASAATGSAPPAYDAAPTWTYEVPHASGQPDVAEAQPARGGGNVAGGGNVTGGGNVMIAVADQQPYTTTAGAAAEPPAGPRKSFVTRQALEVVDPREFRLPAQPPAAPAPLLRVPGPPGIIRR